MKHIRQTGFSLIELMIAILLAAITAIVVLNVLTTYQARANTTTGRNDAEIGAAMGMYALEQEIRMAGAGLSLPLSTGANGPMCGQGVNIAWKNAATTNGNGAPLLPIRIIDGGSGPDSLEMIRSDSDFGAAPTRLIAAMADATAQLSVDGKAGLQNGDLILVGASNAAKICTLMQLSVAPTANGSGWLLSHAAGGTNYYNPSSPGSVFTNAVAYDVGDNVVNMGSYGIRRYGLLCNDGAAQPSATNSCDLAWWNPLDLGTLPLPTVAGVSTVSPQLVELQAQYGVADTGSSIVNAWVDATGSWAAPSSTDLQRIKAVRISIVSRGNREATTVAQSSVTLWQDDPSDPTTARVRTFGADEQRFRYQVLTVVVPVINSIWSGS
ncbi:MAG TPA: PilW family protein [Steroidobacteraceae bacterium]|nr:PilW family protein [Steroidobacteraceae bacterium]